MSGGTALGIVLAHLVGDYLLQSDWMATEKTKRWWPALLHALLYGLPFLFVTVSPAALVVIVASHAVIDRYRLARYVCWAKNLIGPRGWNPPWSRCRATGYSPDRPLWLAVPLMFVADNTIHLVINAASVAWL